jgi:cytochrome c5
MILLPLQAQDDYDRLQIEERIKPVGRVHVIEEPKTATKVKKGEVQTVVKKEPGQDTYDQYCVACHKDGVAGAPKFRDASAWKPRIESAKNIDGLVAIAMKGLNAMPPKGTCQSCTDQEIKKAIEYMLPKS